MKILLLCLFVANSIYAVSVEKLILDHQEKYKVPGVAVVIVENGVPQFLFYGKADPAKNTPIKVDTIFEIASITKVFVTTLLGIELDKGRMRLTDPVVRFIPGLSNSFVQGFKNVKLVDLATHTASLPRALPAKKRPYTREEVIEYLSKWNPPYQLGTKYVYSNLGFGILAYAISGLNYIPFETLLKREVLIPLNMNSTDIEVPRYKEHLWAKGFDKDGKPADSTPVNVLPGGGALKSTPQDMAQFLMANMGIIGPDYLRKAMKLAQQPQFKVSDTLSLGLGWQIFKKDDTTLIDKNGGLNGSASYIGFDDQYQVGVVVLMSKGKSQATTIGRAILFEKLKERKEKQAK